jgi:hypothetical protein
MQNKPFLSLKERDRRYKLVRPTLMDSYLKAKRGETGKNLRTLKIK